MRRVSLGVSSVRSVGGLWRMPSAVTARTGGEYDEIVEMFTDLYPDISVPKNTGRWIGAVQQRMARAGRAVGLSDLWAVK